MHSLEEMNAFLSMLPGGVYACGPDGAIGYANPAACAIFGCADLQALCALSGGSLVELAHPEDQPQLAAALSRLDGSAERLLHRVIRQDGAVRWVRHALLRQQTGTLYGLLLDEGSTKPDRLQHMEERLCILADIDGDIIFDMDCQSGIVDIYGDFARRFGRAPTAEDFQLGLCAEDCVQPRLVHHPYAAQGHMQKMQHDIQLSTGDGRLLWCRHQSAIQRASDGASLRHVGRLLNAEDIKAKEQALLRRAQYDPLTGVYNRETAQELIGRILQKGMRFSYMMLVLDLDDFKHINDTYGHPAGDWVLSKLALLLSQEFRLGDIVGRLGGDEFLLFLSDIQSKEKVFARISRLCRHGFDAVDRSIINHEQVTFSVGGVCSVRPGGTFAALYELADQALYEAKGKGKGRACFRDL